MLWGHWNPPCTLKQNHTMCVEIHLIHFPFQTSVKVSMFLMKALSVCLHVKQYLVICITNGLPQCFHKIFAHGLLLATKKNHAHINRDYADDRYQKLKNYISELIADSYQYIPVANLETICMVWPWLKMNVLCFVGTGGVSLLDWYKISI